MDLPSNSPARASVTTCNGPMFKHLLAGALACLEQNYQRVNQLNVFPVPDGDTGTNMLLTVRNAYQEIATNDSLEIGTIAVRFAHGAIRGSRGNSGTILSELLRGFAHEVSGCREADAQLLARAFREAVRLAYAVVQNPTEGTILTVAREIGEEVEVCLSDTHDLLEILRRVVARSKKSVAQTPELLPILKKAGVVDSGGQGLAYLFEGMLRQAQGEHLMISDAALVESAETGDLHHMLRSTDPQGYGYDVQFILNGQKLDIDTVRTRIGSMGDSMVVIGDDTLIKVHIHVHDPGVPLSYAVSLGVLTDVVVENMQEQSEGYIAARVEQAEPPLDEPEISVNPGEIAVVAVVPGDGLRRVFHGLGVASIISGGQTMNPSNGELLDAIAALNTDKVILLPNNKNIILTAEQAAKQVTDKQVIVIPTRTVPQGIAAMLSFNTEGDLQNVAAMMGEARIGVVTGEVTRATRSIQMDGVDVEEGQLIGLVDGTLVVSGAALPDVVRDLLARMDAAEHELITLYYGAEVSAAEAEALAQTLQSAYPAQEFEVFQGGQPYYYYILSVE